MDLVPRNEEEGRWKRGRLLEQSHSRWIETKTASLCSHFLLRACQYPFLSSFFFFPYILPFFTRSGFVSQGFRCVRGALHRRLFLYVHIDTKTAQRRMHITVPQARKRPSSVLIVFCCLYYSQFLFVFLHFYLSVCLFVCLFVCLSIYDNISAGFITTMRENTFITISWSFRKQWKKAASNARWDSVSRWRWRWWWWWWASSPLDNSSVSLSFVQAFVDINAANEWCRRRTEFLAVFGKNLEYISEFIIHFFIHLI